MARWGWGDGAKSMGLVDHADVWGACLFDGSEMIVDHVDFVDEEAGVYRVLVTDPPGQPPGGRAAGRPPVNYLCKDGDVVRQIKRAKVGLKVVRAAGV